MAMFFLVQNANIRKTSVIELRSEDPRAVGVPTNTQRRRRSGPCRFSARSDMYSPTMVIRVSCT